MNNNKITEIKVNCPECGTLIPLSTEAYNDIVAKVANKEIERRVEIYKAESVARVQEQLDYEKNLVALEGERQLEVARTHYIKMKNDYDGRIAKMQQELDSASDRTTIAVREAEAAKDRLIAQEQVENATLKEMMGQNNSLNDARMAALKSSLERDCAARINEAEEHYREEITNLNIRIQGLLSECRNKDDQIESIKNFKSKLSTKLLGESLEEHCGISFDRYLQPCLPNATFKKDTSNGEKCDFVYRETFDFDSRELLSIAFEMKTQDNLSGSKKKKNKDHLAKLEGDRKRRGCKYGVLVSTLEPDDDRYNSGIVIADGYDNLLIVRPNNFVDVIHLLRRMALSNAELENELEVARNHNLDIATFESKLEEYKDSIGNVSNHGLSEGEKMLKRIDSIITSLEKHKAEINKWLSDCRKLSLKGDDLTIKNLTIKNPTMLELFEEAESQVGDESGVGMENKFVTTEVEPKA